ncbi:PREDICTED: CD44 antigen isoform X3 [Dipodomys ordii]|uniref:CD44 antigen n=1 Tax=Dipodomys ordii TaxID=10020 RepID=A0A1S3FF19_DIPOR|nr:PREDICTED: CD44 antigen isoform X3 [Dipodomys ordii]
MNNFWWHAAWGLYCLVQLSLAQTTQIDLNITCRYAGVFHVEKNGRYSISRTEAADLCQAFNSSLPTMAQMVQALHKGFETCRYGFIEGHVVIPRITPNSICAANHTGVYILNSNSSHYDTYCFNASAPLDKEDCASVTDLPNSFDGPVTITIVNRDGTRYSKKGEYRTNPEDINPTNPIDEEISSGSPSEKGTSESYIFSTNLPVTHPSPDQDSTSIYKSTPATTSAHNSHPSERMTTQSQEYSSQTDFYNSVSDPMGPGHQTEGRMDMVSSHNATLQPTADPNPDLVKDLDRTGPVSMTTQQSHSQNFSTPSGDLQDENDHPTASTPTPSNRNNSRGGRRGENLPEDSTTPLEGYTTPYPHTMENRTLSTVTPTQTGALEETEVTVVAEPLPGDEDVVDSSGRSHTTHGSESDGPSSGSQEGGVNTTSGPIRKPQIPEWLIILASLLALALILAVCIAVNSRRRCGQKKKLVINNGNGTVEDRKPSGLNGDASKSQEMVHLVNKESSETPDQFTTTDETQNLQNADEKIGV